MWRFRLDFKDPGAVRILRAGRGRFGAIAENQAYELVGSEVNEELLRYG